MSGVIGALIGSYVRPSFIATGGNQIITAGGFKFHIFTSSGTLTVQSGQSTLNILSIGGGGAGQNAPFTGSSSGRAGAGGVGGWAYIGTTTAPVSSNVTVTVAAGVAGNRSDGVNSAGNASQVSVATNWTTIDSGAAGDGGQAVASYPDVFGQDGFYGGEVPLISSRGTPWSALSFNLGTNTGGGGGGSTGLEYSMYFYGGDRYGNFGGGGGYDAAASSNNGGGNAFMESGTSGQNASANTGAGGGGSGLYTYYYYSSPFNQTGSTGGNGGSGIVIIAYPA